MDEVFSRVFGDFVARTDGPMWFRIILQPAVAIFFGVRAGLRNAQQAMPHGEGAHGFTDPVLRRAMLRQAWKDVGKVAVIGVVLDLVFQWIVWRTVHPLETVVVVMLLVALPYQITRTVVASVARRKQH